MYWNAVPFFLTVYITCVTLTLVRCRTLNSCRSKNTLNSTNNNLVTLEDDIYDIAVSPHTDNIYIAHWYKGLLLIETGKNLTKAKVEIGSNVNSVAVENDEPKVYIGGNEGIRIYNEITKIVTIVEKVKCDIWKLFVPKHREELYLVTGDVYRYRSMFTEQLKLKIEIEGDWRTQRLVVDNNDTIYYTNREETKIQLKGEENSLIYNFGPFWALAVDNQGRVYGTSLADHGVYLLSSDASRPNLVTTLDFTPACMCFDKNNNAIFGTEDNRIIIFKLDSICSPLPTPELDNTSMTMNTENTTQQNLIIESENKLNKTTEQNFNMFNKLKSEIKDIREKQNAEYERYNDIISNITNTAKELKHIINGNNMKSEAEFESKIYQIVHSKMENLDSDHLSDEKTENSGNDRTASGFRSIINLLVTNSTLIFY